MQPLVSILIPVFNGHDYLREAVDSALAQTYPNIEVLIINDGSTDDTESIVLSYGDKVRYLYKENGGVSSALNLGIREMRGEYVSWLSHDDVYLPQKVEAQVKALSACEGEDVIVYCDCGYIDSQSRPLPSRGSLGLPADAPIDSKRVLHYLLRHGSLNGCGFLIPKSAFEKNGFFDEKLRYAQDVLMWYRLFAGGYALRVIPEKLVNGRIHQKQQTRMHRDRLNADGNELSKIVIPLFDGISTVQDDFVYEHALRAALHGNRTVVSECKKVLIAKKRFKLSRKIALGAVSGYGKIRPAIRKLYYRLFRHIKTE